MKAPAFTLEGLLIHATAFGLTTASPLQRAVCRLADGLPLRDLAGHSDVIAAIGDVASLPVGVRPAEQKWEDDNALRRELSAWQRPPATPAVIQKLLAEGRITPVEAHHGGDAVVRRRPHDWLRDAMRDFASIVAELGPDERRVLECLAARLLEGQRVYGRLDLASDRRDWRHERSLEL